MHKRNKIALLLTIPSAIFTWFIGWSLYWIGSKGKATKPSKILDKKLTFTVLTPEQKCTI